MVLIPQLLIPHSNSRRVSAAGYKGPLAGIHPVYFIPRLRMPHLPPFARVRWGTGGGGGGGVLARAGVVVVRLGIALLPAVDARVKGHP